MQPFLTRRSVLGGILTACAGLLTWKSPLWAAPGDPARKLACGYAAEIITASYSYDVATGAAISRTTYDRRGRVIKRVEYSQAGTL